MARLVQGWVDRRRSEPTVTTIERQSDAPPTVDARRLVATEAEALLTRLERMTRLTLLDTTSPAAAVLPDALAAMDRSVRTAQRELRSCTRSFLDWLDEAGRRAHPAEVRRRFVLVRLRFTDLLTHFDTFADALTQRSEHGTGVWLAGLDACADDALQVPLDGWDPPQVVCYLDRGAGAAIRRARTRLPGGGSNPVALIRVPRERMIGSGIAASLVHEVGHQAAALLCLVESLRAAVRAAGTARAGLDRVVWDLWQRWVSEIVADLWAVARVGVGATVGLLSVVSLPEAFVFRVAMDDPHPTPWIRVQLSAAIGEALYPDAQWAELRRSWRELYPITAAARPNTAALLTAVRRSIPELVALLLDHHNDATAGATLGHLARHDRNQATALRRVWASHGSDEDRIGQLAPIHAFAVLGQAKADGLLSSAAERQVVDDLLGAWALDRHTRWSTALANVRRD